jgi:predicted DsbA family dithiol-disulfide isomerase
MDDASPLTISGIGRAYALASAAILGWLLVQPLDSRHAMNVEIRSDIACPWCYIGKRRFEAALAAFDHADEVSVTWRSFELDPDHAAQDAFKERLLRAYLGEGEVIGDLAVLERLALDTGLPADEVRDVLAGDRFAAEVREDERTATLLGISAVPFFVVDRALGASGDQPPEALGELLARGWSDRSPLTTVAPGDGCGIDGC